jgi:hypothetical protein
MTLSAKWTAVSFLTLATVAAGSIAFAGCTVTSGKTDDFEGGTGNPPVDSSTPTPDAGDAAVAKCEGNKQTGSDIVSATCQQKLNTACCTELKTCFDIVLTKDMTGARGTDNCDAYRACLDQCEKTETDPAKLDLCDKDCVTLTQDSVVNAYNDIIQCATDKGQPECK